MRTVQAKDMTDEQWQSFAKMYEFLNKEFYSKYSDGKDADWIELKNRFLNEVCAEENSFSDSFYIINNNKVIAYIDAYERRGNLYFIYDYFGKDFTFDILKYIFKEVKKLSAILKKKNTYFSTNYERHFKPLLETGVEIIDETLTSILLKKDINFDFLKKITEENIYAADFDLKLFREIPKKIYKEYIRYWNEVQNDKNEFHPKKYKSREFTMKDLLDRVKDMINEKDIYYMYTLFDKEVIAAYCSVVIEFINNKPAIQHCGNLTSVGRNYRGKGFAKYLKAKMYLKIQEDYPDFEQIITDTYPWNKYMYRINEEFGFKPYQKGYTFRFTKEFLESFLK